ncbi:hypothetical protein CA13_36590 [Planctomycetes bacterium CA13]|uniref:Uncharacterized protein n=1 Tax=Novipirellula herctigrandis TaxID=2527986 RepID=A0A5C5Z4D4_9BACT|nr:hypothetical protein CA13_36590 [Planctomycetes bacterium CA13]
MGLAAKHVRRHCAVASATAFPVAEPLDRHGVVRNAIRYGTEIADVNVS